MPESNARRFLDAYASIETSLNKLSNRVDYVPFKTLVAMTAKYNKVVKNHMTMLKEYADLRNAIVHERGREQEIIAEPSDSVTQDIERIAALLKQDQNIMNYVTTPVVFADENTTIYQAYQQLYKNHADKLPIYEKGIYQGLVTMKEIASWVMEGKDKNALAKELPDNQKQRVVFLKRNDDINTVIKVFDQSIKQKLSSPVILVTESGKSNEKALGILSSYDVLRILTAIG